MKTKLIAILGMMIMLVSLTYAGITSFTDITERPPKDIPDLSEELKEEIGDAYYVFDNRTTTCFKIVTEKGRSINCCRNRTRSGFAETLYQAEKRCLETPQVIYEKKIPDEKVVLTKEVTPIK